MGIAEEQRKQEQVYRELLPEIVDVVSRRDEQVEAAEDISRRVGVDTRTVYRWITLTEQELDRARRRRVIVTLIPLWGGILAIVATGVLLFAGRIDVGSPGTIVVGILAVVAVAGATASLVGVGERSARRWLRRNAERESEL
jgi:hypothetical protein